MPPAPVGQQPPGPGAPPPFAPAGAQRAGGASWDFSALDPSDWLVAIGGIVMLIGTFFYFVSYVFLFPLLGLALVVLVVLDKLAKVPQVADWQGLTWVYIIVGGFSVLLGLISLLNIVSWSHGLIPFRWYITPILELLASGAVLAGGLMRRKAGL